MEVLMPEKDAPALIPRVVTEAELARILRLSVKSVARMRAQRWIPVLPGGVGYRCPRYEVEAVFEALRARGWRRQG